MKISICLFVSSMLLLGSCKRLHLGRYLGEFDSGVKHISGSSLTLEKNNEFELEYSTTSFESVNGSTSITVLTGTFKIEDDQLIIVPTHQKTNWLSYGKNNNTDELQANPAGVRNTAYIVMDTFYGPTQMIENPEPMKFTITDKEHSNYLWNHENCYVHYHYSKSSNDIINHCTEIRGY